MVKLYSNFLLDFLKLSNYKFFMLNKLFKIFVFFIPFITISCTVPYNYEFVPQAVQGNIACEYDKENGTCSCPLYTENGKKCVKNERLALWEKYPNTNYNKKAEVDNNSLICDVENGYELKYGFCAKEREDIEGDWSVGSNGYEIEGINGYSVHDLELFSGNTLCVSYINNDNATGLINCRRSDNQLTMDYYLRINSIDGYEIKDIYFHVDGDNITLGVLYFNGSKVYKFFNTDFKVTNEGIDNTSFSIDSSNQIFVGDTITSDYELSFITDLSGDIPGIYEDLKVLALNRVDSKFYTHGIICGNGNGYDIPSGGLKTGSYFKMGFDNYDTYFYTYKNESGQVTFCYDLCDIDNQYVNTDFNIKASSVGYFENKYSFYNTSFEDGTNFEIKVKKDPSSNLEVYNEDKTVHDIDSNVEENFIDFHTFGSSIFVTVAEMKEDGRVNVYYEGEASIINFTNLNMQEAKFKVTDIVIDKFNLTYKSNNKFYLYLFDK